jgi:hypothetical protein
MRSSRPNTVHVSAIVLSPRRRERRVRDPLRIEPKPRLLRVILSCWERAGNHF